MNVIGRSISGDSGSITDVEAFVYQLIYCDCNRPIFEDLCVYTLE